MRTWHACWGSDELGGECGPKISVEERPLWFYLLEQFGDRFCCWFFLHHISLPNWPRCCGDKEDLEYYGGKYLTPKEYYGDLGCIWVSLFLNGFVNRLYPKYVKSVSFPLTEEQVALHPNHDDKIFWMQEKRRHIEWEAEEKAEEAEKKAKAAREATGDSDQPGLSRPDAGGTGASS